MSLGTGRPAILRDENSTKYCRVLLRHHMASPTDVRLVSQIELIAQKCTSPPLPSTPLSVPSLALRGIDVAFFGGWIAQIYETLSPLNGQFNQSTLAFIRRANDALDKWWASCDELHRRSLSLPFSHPIPSHPTPSLPLLVSHRRLIKPGSDMSEDSLLRKILAGELYYAKLWLVCVALRGVSWDKMPFEQRELAFSAKDSATQCLATFLNSQSYRYVSCSLRGGWCVS